MKTKVSELKVEDYVLRTRLPPGKRKPRKPRRKAGEFLRGPIPWAWIKSAAKTRGSALFVALAIRHFRDLMKQRTVRVSMVDLGCGAVARLAVLRALRLLESRGLIEVNRGSGKLLAITVLEIFPNVSPIGSVRSGKANAS